MRAATTGILIATFVAGTSSAMESMPHGLWLTENTRAIIEIAPCEGRTCGRIVWMASPIDESGQPKRDVNNKDEFLRDRTLCGLTLIGDLVAEPDDDAYFGFVYNPRNGRKYTARVTALSHDTLEMRGFLGISAFGKSQTWTRVADDRGGCADEIKKASAAKYPANQ